MSMTEFILHLNILYTQLKEEKEHEDEAANDATFDSTALTNSLQAATSSIASMLHT